MSAIRTVALHYVREHACDGISVEDILAHVPVSRRTLERRFASQLRRSPSDQVTRVRLGQVKRLLATTGYSLARIAQLSGFGYAESMCALFKRTTAQTPGQYRRAARGVKVVGRRPGGPATGSA